MHAWRMVDTAIAIGGGKGKGKGKGKERANGILLL